MNRHTFIQAADSNYLPAGLALYRSLLQHMSGEWRMVWVVLDESGLVAVRRWAERNADAARYLECVDWRVVAAEVPGLPNALLARLDAEGRRTSSWWWTWAAQVTHWQIERSPEDTAVFMDTDCYAFADLSPALAEVAAAGADVGMLTHRFPPHRAHMAARAHFNVGTLTTFRPTMRARMAAAAWAAMVRARCEVEDPGDAYLGIPPGRAGDQAFMDAIGCLARVHEITDPGTGLAPYNFDAWPIANIHREVAKPAWLYADDERMPTYAETQQKFTTTVSVMAEDRPHPVRLAHFHESRFDQVTGAVVKRTGYPIPADVERHLLAPYEAAVAAAAAELR